MTTTRLNMETATRTTLKALAFGALTAVVAGLGIAHAAEQRELRASVVTLDPVVITVHRQQLPTVYVTGRRISAAAGTLVATAD